MIGIYKLIFNGTDKCYIGQSRVLESRFSGHLDKLKAGTGSKKMQEAYKEFGLPISLKILAECSIQELDILEMEYIKQFDSVSNGFNTLHKAGECTPLPGELNGMSKYSNTEILDTFKYLIIGNISAKDICSLTGVSEGIIHQIARGHSHKWLYNIDPSGYELMLSRLNSRNCATAYNILYPEICSPEGTKYIITNASAFAKEHKLDPGNLGKVLHGQRKSHKGWKLA